MQAKHILSDVVPVLSVFEKGQKALNWMEIFRISHLPIVDEAGDYLGLISDNDIYDYDLAEKKVGTKKLTLERPFVLENAHIYEVILLISSLKLTIIPVLDDEMHYVGVITLHELVHQFGSLVAVQAPGVVFVLDLKQNDYSLAQIAQIVEGNDAKILSTYLKKNPETLRSELTVKINTVNFGPIRQTLERYGYQVKDSYFENEAAEKDLDEKFEEFMTYLNV